MSSDWFRQIQTPNKLHVESMNMRDLMLSILLAVDLCGAPSTVGGYFDFECLELTAGDSHASSVCVKFKTPRRLSL